jgi:hypothetical protein
MRGWPAARDASHNKENAMNKTLLTILALTLASSQVQAAASGKHYTRKAGGTQQSSSTGSGGGSGKVRIQKNNSNIHMLNPQPLPPG